MAGNATGAVMSTQTFTGTSGTAIREDQWIITVDIPTIQLPVTYSWTEKEGGQVTAENTFTRPGGLRPGASLGGPSMRSDVTVKRQYTTALDPYIESLENACGNTRMSVSWQPLGANGAPNGAIHTIGGILKEVQVPQANANATAASFLTLVMSADLQAAQTPLTAATA